MKKLVLLVEGEGDELALPVLLSRLLHALDANDELVLDPAPMRVGTVGGLTGPPKNRERWLRYLKAARNREDVGAILLLLNGHVATVEGEEFRPASVAFALADRSRQVGAGSDFSLACVFARREYESWLIAGVESLAGRPLPDGRPGIPEGTKPPEEDLEQSPLSARQWLGRVMKNGYKPTVDQKPLTEMLDLHAVRRHGMPSFWILEAALKEMVQALERGQHIVTPARIS